jgi:methylated-DNA-[protein]-cysteine S-methyltransferase
MERSGLALFETAIGHCGIAWSAEGVAGVQLPEATPVKTLTRLRRKLPQLREINPPKNVREAIHGIAALLNGARIDLSPIVLDFSGTGAWDRSVYVAARAIGPGETATYGELAARLGDAGRAREVGQSLAQNPWPILVPCHRVTAAKGRTGGFSARGGVRTKLRLLEIESRHACAALPLFAGG